MEGEEGDGEDKREWKEKKEKGKRRWKEKGGEERIGNRREERRGVFIFQNSVKFSLFEAHLPHPSLQHYRPLSNLPAYALRASCRYKQRMDVLRRSGPIVIMVLPLSLNFF